MKKNLPLFIVFLAFVGCTTDDYSAYSYNDSTIYSQSDNHQFTEIIGFISPYLLDNDEKKYILVDNLTDIEIAVNKKIWQCTESYSINTEKIQNKEQVGNYWVTSEKIVYPVVINIRIDADNFSTAGEYANLINNYYTLPPGIYVCQLQTFCFTTVTGSTQQIEIPGTYFPLEVKSNEVSANIGEFEILIQ